MSMAAPSAAEANAAALPLVPAGTSERNHVCAV